MKPGTPEYADYQTFFALHKGAGITCLAGLVVLGRAAGISELASLVKYSRPSVDAALETLRTHGLVEHVAYRGGWMLTARGRQLPFFHLLEAEAEELSKVFTLEGSSSGFNSGDSSLSTPTTTTSELSKLFTLEGRQAVQALLSMGGVGPAKAEAAVQACLDKGESLEQISGRIARCAAYTLDPASKGLRYRGGWAAAMIAGGYEPADADLLPDHETDTSAGWLAAIAAAEAERTAPDEPADY